MPDGNCDPAASAVAAPALPAAKLSPRRLAHGEIRAASYSCPRLRKKDIVWGRLENNVIIPWKNHYQDHKNGDEIASERRGRMPPQSHRTLSW